jgi:preprotein translocase subunit SecD
MKPTGELRTSNQKRASTRIFVGFLLVVAVGWAGWQLYSNWYVSQIKFTAIEPGKVNLVGIELGRGFHITVSNRVAQLVESADKEGDSSKDGFGGGNQIDASSNSGADNGAKKRVSIRYLMESLQGNVDALGQFVMAQNNIKEDDLTPGAPRWLDTDLEKALKGDPTLSAKHERDLNVKLDGTPLPVIRPDAMWDGIVILAHVPVHVNVGGAVKLLQAPITLAFKAELMSAVEKDVAEKPNLSDELIGIYYQQEAQRILANSKYKEDVGEVLSATISPNHMQEYARDPERILESAVILVTEKNIDKAQCQPNVTDTGTLYNLSMDLNKEGRDRLWYYSKKHLGFQLLLVSNGVAIAAPTIRYELSNTSLVITNLPDQDLVQQAVDTINRKSRT